MDGWIIALIVAVAQTVITTAVGTIVGLIIKSKWEKHKQEQTELEKLREEKRAASEAQRCNVVKQAVHEEVEQLEGKVRKEFINLKQEVNAKIETLAQDTGLLKDAIQKDLYIDLFHLGEDFKEKGFATRAEKTDFDRIYWSYHALGKNGMADTLYKEVMELSEKEVKTTTSGKGKRKKQTLLENK